MLIRQNNINFTSQILPSMPLKSTFWTLETSHDVLYRRKVLNMLDALINDGQSDIIELKETPFSKDEKFIQAFINGNETNIRCKYNKNNKTPYPCFDAVCTVIERLQKRRAPIEKMQKFGFKKMKELYNKIFIK